MAKYIDAERYINNLRELRTGDKDTVYEYYDDGIDVAISEAATFPAADVVEVVRCKDCKYDSLCFSDVEMTNRSQTGKIYKQIEWCSYGERKDG